jgi:hypothetical protein
MGEDDTHPPGTRGRPQHGRGRRATRKKGREGVLSRAGQRVAKFSDLANRKIRKIVTFLTKSASSSSTPAKKARDGPIGGFNPVKMASYHF